MGKQLKGLVEPLLADRIRNVGVNVVLTGVAVLTLFTV